MLTRNFKTAAELQIEQWELDGLIKVLTMMERGEIRDFPRNGFTQPPLPTLCWFDMGDAGEETYCGTVACIGGWVGFLSGRYPTMIDGEWHTFSSYVTQHYSKALEELYYPLLYAQNTWRGITVANAVVVLGTFLTTGVIDWSSVRPTGA